MTWVRLDDQMPDHPKFIAVGPLAAWLYIAGLCYCSRQLTDGLIPKNVVPRLAAVKAPMKLADSLVKSGLWTDEGFSYRVHDYLTHQRSREQVQRERDSARVRAKSRRDTKRSHGDRSPEVRVPETEVETDRTPLPPQSGGSKRANGTSPRQIAAKRKVELLEQDVSTCSQCADQGWECARCARKQARINELRAEAAPK